MMGSSLSVRRLLGNPKGKMSSLNSCNLLGIKKRKCKKLGKKQRKVRRKLRMRL